jgi:hypothetical protein
MVFKYLLPMLLLSGCFAEGKTLLFIPKYENFQIRYPFTSQNFVLPKKRQSIDLTYLKELT